MGKPNCVTVTNDEGKESLDSIGDDINKAIKNFKKENKLRANGSLSKGQQKSRDEIEFSLTWDLTAIFKTEKEYEEAVETIKKIVLEAEAHYKGKLTTVLNITQYLELLQEIKKLFSLIGHYNFLALAVDEGNSTIQARHTKFRNIAAGLGARLSLIDSELTTAPIELLKEVIKESGERKGFIEEILRAKPYALHPEVERALEALTNTLTSPRTIYNKAKLVDINFPNFNVDGESHPLSFALFEGKWEHEVKSNRRRIAFKVFSNKLREYQHTFAAAYQTQVQKEKTLASLRGHNSVIDYLLFDQRVDRSLFDRQIDIIMEELAPHMRKYANLLKGVHQLDELTYADLKLSLDPDFKEAVTIEEAKEYILMGLSIMGKDYTDMIKKSFDERWIDFAINKGKTTGAFSTTPYGVHPYILLSWSDTMRDVFILAHELGHAGHSVLTNKNQSIFNTNVSRYFVEAPSTINELLLAQYLLSINTSPRFQRWVISSIVSRTYYHNFVTHLLEAAFQREVYEIIDKGGSVQAETLNRIKRGVLERFWGDTVKINEGAELTWMRQPHYYMGLYPYTYSAGLTIATAVSSRIVKEGQPAIDDWMKVLKAGGSKTPVELAKMVKVDITTEEPLRNTIKYIGRLVDDLVELTKTIGFLN